MLGTLQNKALSLTIRQYPESLVTSSLSEGTIPRQNLPARFKEAPSLWVIVCRAEKSRSPPLPVYSLLRADYPDCINAVEVLARFESADDSYFCFAVIRDSLKQLGLIKNGINPYVAL
jgi:hypothetical protein